MFEKLKNKKILVTGGAGFIGTNLIKKLLDIGCKKIRATYHNREPIIIDKNVEYIKCDLVNKKDCEKITKDIDYVIMGAANSHGAAFIEKHPLDLVTPNVIMNLLMLESSYKNNVEKFIFLSSNTVYPVVDYPVKEEEMMDGDVFEKYYGVAWGKRYSEILCKTYSTKIKNPMKTIVIRPANLYGNYEDFEWETSHVIPALIRKVVERHSPIEVWGDGSDIKDFTYIDDFINGLLMAIEKIEEFTQVNIGTGIGRSIREVLNIILEIENYNGANIVFNKSKPTMIPKRILDISKAKFLLGYEPKIDIQEGLEKTIKWYKKNKNL